MPTNQFGNSLRAIALRREEPTAADQTGRGKTLESAQEKIMSRRVAGAFLRSVMGIAATFFLATVLPGGAHGYNWEWDQGHDCVIVRGEHGHWGYTPGEWVADPCCICKASPVFVRSGSFQEIFTDLEVGGVGPSLNVVRAYNSSDPASGLLGYGWSLTFGKRLVVATDDQTNRRFLVVKQSTGQMVTFWEQEDGTYEIAPGPGVTYALVENSDGTFTITENDGTRSEYNAGGQLKSVTDRNGNRLNVQYDQQGGCPQGAQDAAGRSLTISLGPNGKIARIQDFAGRAVEYGYSSDGNLISVTDPLGHMTSYVYDSGHRLLRITDPRGHVTVALTYDSEGRIGTYTEQGITYTMSYQDGKTVKTDSQGRVWTCFFDEHGFVYREVDPLGHVKRRAFDLVTSNSPTVESFGDDTPQNLSLLSGTVATASSSYPGAHLVPAMARDGSVATYWLSNQSDTAPWLQMTFASPVRVSGVVIVNPTWYYNYAFLTATLSLSNGYTQAVTLGQPSIDVTIPTQDGITWARITALTVAGPYQVIAEFAVMQPADSVITWTYTYDDRGNRTSATDPLGNTTSYTYESVFNRLETKTDPRGVATKYEYDLRGNVTRQYTTGPAMEKDEDEGTRYTYDAAGNMLSMTDPDGFTWNYTYDEYGNLLTVSDPMGHVQTYAYNVLGLESSVTDPRGFTTLFEYDAMGRLTREIDPLGNTTTYTYDAAGNQASVSDAAGHRTTFAYDNHNRVTQVTDPLGNSTIHAYDAVGDEISVIDANGNVTQYSHDAVSRLTSVTDALGGVTSYVYDLVGNVTAITDPNGNTTTRAYDAIRRLSAERDAVGAELTYVYDAVGNRTSLTTATGNTITSVFDDHNREVSVADVVGTIRTTQRNGRGLVASIADASGRVVSLRYDPAGRVIEREDPDGNVTRFERDASANIVARIDAQGDTTRYLYDAVGRAIAEIDPLGHQTRRSYDAVGNVLSLTDANGNTTAYEYDDRGARIAVVYANGSRRSYVYDGLQNVVAMVSPKGDTTRYGYDSLSRKVRTLYADGNEELFSYDGVGNLRAASNGASALVFDYDTGDRLIRAGESGRSVQYGYGVGGLQKTMTYPSGFVVRETIDVRGDLERIEDGDGNEIVQYEHTAPGRVASKRLGGAATVTFGYDNSDRVTEITQLRNGVTEVALRYAYDAEGARVVAEDVLQPARSRLLDYDEGQQLVRERVGELVNGDIPAPVRQGEVEYDNVGNWRSVVEDGIEVEREHNAMNETIGVGATVYSYDPNGNLIDDGENLYEYDAADRLVRTARKADGQPLMECAYDALGRRSRRIVHVPQVDDRTLVYDGKSFLLLEEDTAGGGEYSHVSHVWGEDVYGGKGRVGGVGGLVLTVAAGSGARTVYCYDGSGNVQMLLDAPSGGVVGEYEYSAFGRTVSVSGARAGTNPFRFSTKYADSESRLIYYGFRYYSPELGRFSSVDPLGEAGGTNLYLFCRNSPLTNLDFLGLYPGQAIDLIDTTPLWIGVCLANKRRVERINGEARLEYAKQKRDYTCCWNGENVSMDRFWNPTDGNRTSHQVLHGMAGCKLGQAGISRNCMMLANVGYEIITSYTESIGREDRSFGDYLRDTGYDIGAVAAGYEVGRAGRACTVDTFHPPQCARTTGEGGDPIMCISCDARGGGGN